MYKSRRIGGFAVCCRGKLVRSPDLPCGIFSGVLVVVPSIVQIVFG